MGNCWLLVASQQQQGRLRNVFTSACLSRGIPRVAADIVAKRGGRTHVGDRRGKYPKVLPAAVVAVRADETHLSATLQDMSFLSKMATSLDSPSSENESCFVP